MQNVKRTFFLTEEEVKKQREIQNDRQIVATLPHYELEDGTIVFGKHFSEGGAEYSPAQK